MINQWLKKGMAAALSFIFLFVFIVQPVLAAEGRIIDHANLLQENERARLEQISEEVSTKWDTEFFVLTLEGTGGKLIEQYIGDLYDEGFFNIGNGNRNVAVLALDMQERDVILMGFDETRKILDNERLTLIREKITPDLSGGNYERAFQTYLELADEYMGITPGVNPDNPLFIWWVQLIISVVIGAAVVGILYSLTGGKKVTVHEGTYRDPHTSKVLRRRDRFTHKTVTKRKIEKNNNKGIGGGGMTRGGTSFSSSKGKF